jgi:hypothetical protein
MSTKWGIFTKRFALRLSGHVQEIANTTRERAVKYLNFSLGELARCLSDSALQIDLNQGEALFRVGSSLLLQV